MSTRVYLMRHGEVVNSGEKRYNGHIDVDVTQNGIDQMHRLAQLLSGKSIAAVYSSDLIRSVKGAEIIARSLGLTSKSLVILRERSVGAWEGLTADEVKVRYPAEYAAWGADLLNYRPPNGECLNDVRERILPAYRDLIAAHPNQEIALLLHGGINRVIIGDALGLDPMNLFRIDQSFGALNVIDYFEDGVAVVRLLNSV